MFIIQPFTVYEVSCNLITRRISAQQQDGGTKTEDETATRVLKGFQVDRGNMEFQVDRGNNKN